MARKNSVDGEEKDDREPEDIMMDLMNTPRDIRQKSVGLRNNMSGFEKKVWTFLGKDENPWSFLRQWPMEGYFLDFYSQHYNVALEADGPHHLARAAQDLVRDKVLLKKKGIRTIRLTPANFLRYSKEELFEYVTNAIENVEDKTD